MADLSIPTSASAQQIDRRVLIRSAAATAALFAAVGTPVLGPTVFDAVAYIRDLRAADLIVTTNGDYVMFLAKPGKGFGVAYHDVQIKWAHAMKGSPDHTDLVRQALVAENT